MSHDQEKPQLFKCHFQRLWGWEDIVFSNLHQVVDTEKVPYTLNQIRKKQEYTLDGSNS
jgi:hypothetical protein